MHAKLQTSLLVLALFGITGAAVLYGPAPHSAEGGPAVADPFAGPLADPVADPAADPAADPVIADPRRDPAAAALASQQPVIEAVFVLDTTGSMGGLIQTAKDKIWSIASTMAAAQPAPEIRIGLVAYRDRGDAYVTQVTDLSSDLDRIHGELMQLQAQGGGDSEESVNQALHEALTRIGWSQEAATYQVIFLVGDAPPHHDYPDDVPYAETLAAAAQRGIRVNAIQCGDLPATRQTWQQIAQLGGGDYLQVGQGGSAVAIATPFDAELAALSAALDKTRIYYGRPAERAEKAEALAATQAKQAAASPAAMARRAEFVASDSAARAYLGDKELVDEVSSGRLDLANLPVEELPAPIAELDAAERDTLIAETAERREALRQQIKTLSQQRSAFVAERLEASGGAADSLDYKLFETVRKQAKDSGLRYEEAAPVY